jgi:uncharacterized protein YbjT (DUF2867 family)
MILITGATGTTGSALVKQLSKKGERVRAFVRNLDKAKALKGLNVELTKGDLSDVASIDAAMKGVDRVFVLSSFDPKQAELQGNVVKAAKRAGAKRIVKMGALGTAPDSHIGVARWHAQTEKEIEDSGLEYTHLHPSLFMQFSFVNAPTIKSHGAFYGSFRDGKISMVDARDIAAVAAVTLTEHGHAGKTYTITGPEALSMDDVAGKIGDAIGKTVKYVDVPPEASRKTMLENGMPDWFADDLLKLAEVFAAGHASEVVPTVEQVTGTKARSFDQFVKDFADAFKG